MSFIRPYFAVVKDSFRAALATRVLYVMVVAITLVLLVFAPIAVHDSIHWKTKDSDIEPRFQAIFSYLVNNYEDESRADVKKIWESLDDNLQKDIREVERSVKGSGGGAANANDLNIFQLQRSIIGLRRAFNDLAQTEDFYDEDAWKRIPKNDELSELIETGDGRTDLQNKRMNRLLLESSIPMLRKSQESAIEFKYLHWDITTLNLTRDQFKAIVVAQLPYYFDKFVMSIGLFVAILITSNMIPEMFNPGTLNLLLSKPVHRWALLIAKFVGGCAFITMCSTYLFAGLWLILGIQWGIWESSILLSIVLYMIVFAIYYSVSVFVGIVFRSSIVSVICTILFWAVCFVTGVVYSLFELGIEKNEVTKVVRTNDELYHLDYFSNLHVWNEEKNQWDRKYPGANEQAKLGLQGLYVAAYFQAWVPQPITERQRMVAPVYSNKYQAFLAGGAGQQGFVLDPPDMFVYDANNNGEYMSRGTFPAQTQFLVQENEDGDLLVVTRSGMLYRLVEDPVKPPIVLRQNQQKENESAEANDEQSKDENNDAGLEENRNENANDDAEPDVQDESDDQNDPVQEDKANETPDEKQVDSDAGDQNNGGATEQKKYFEQVVDLPIGRVESPGSISVNASKKELAHFNDGKVSVYKKNDSGQYEFDRRIDLQLGPIKDFSHWIVYRGNYIVVAIGSGDIILVDANTMVDLKEYQPETKVGIDQLVASNNGRWFAVLYQNGNLWMMDANESDLKFTQPNKVSQGNVTGVNFDRDDHICIGSDVGRLDIYDMKDWSNTRSIRPDRFELQTSYEYVIRPLYWICPKPGEFYPLVAHLSRKQSAEEDQVVDWSVTPQKKNPWSPVINGLIFMAFMLVISCIWFQRSDY